MKNNDIKKIFLKIFIYLFERDRDSEREREPGRRGEDRKRSTFFAEQGAWCGAQFQDPEITTWAEGRHLTNRVTYMPLRLILNSTKSNMCSTIGPYISTELR